MTEWDVKEIIRKDREDRGPGCFGVIVIFLTIILFIIGVDRAGKDYRLLQERVKALEVWRADWQHQSEEGK